MLGRRGPVQAAFTNPEIRELGEMEDADVIVDPAEVELDPASAAYLESDEADKTTRVNVETLREFSQRDAGGQARSGSSCASSPRRSRSRATARSRGS